MAEDKKEGFLMIVTINIWQLIIFLILSLAMNILFAIASERKVSRHKNYCTFEFETLDEANEFMDYAKNFFEKKKEIKTEEASIDEY